MTEQPNNPIQAEGDPSPIDADLGNYDESGHAVAAPSEESNPTGDAEQSSQAENDQQTSAGNDG
jgi:hypothetical protein